MQEHSVTVAEKTHHLDEPFFVLATQNPIEMEGTYPLPEAQLDRFFFKVNLPFPETSDLVEILARTTGAEMPAAGIAATGSDILAMRDLAAELVADVDKAFEAVPQQLPPHRQLRIDGHERRLHLLPHRQVSAVRQALED